MSTTEYVSKSEYDELFKTVKKLQRQMKRVMKSLKQNDPDEKPKKATGFAKPTTISPELASFLGLEKDDLIARTEVTKKINVYVKENGLQNEKNKRVIVLDDTLRKLINPPEDVELTFFNLQKYLKHHYVTPVVESVPDEVVDLEDSPKEDKVKKVVKKKVKK